MGAASEFARKHARLGDWLAERSVDGVILQSPANVAWLASGGDLRRRHGPAPVFVVSTQRAFLLAASDDTDRLRQEEVRGLTVEIVPLLATGSDGVHERALAVVPDAKTWRSDTAGTPFEHDPGLDTLREELLPQEVDRLARLARDAASALEEVAAECYRGILERDAAARLTAECIRRQIEPREILAGADERSEAYIRPLPKAGVAERTLLLGLIGMRHGLHVALSRTLCLSRPADPFIERFHANLTIAARLRHETRAGDTLGATVQRALPQPPVHLGPLGGATGYSYPEHDARASSTVRLQPPQGLVWSVAGAGARVEDTYLLDASGLEQITATEGWPRRTVRVNGSSYDLPDLLLL